MGYFKKAEKHASKFHLQLIENKGVDYKLERR